MAVAALAAASIATAATGHRAGKIKEFPTSWASGAAGIVAGPNRTVWFAGGNRVEGGAGYIARMRSSGKIRVFHFKPGDAPSQLAVARNGDIWFTDPGTRPAVGRMTPAGRVKEFYAGLQPESSDDPSCPVDIAAAPNGDMWFTDSGAGAIGRITPAGTITEFRTGLPGNSFVDSITAGPGGDMWFTDPGAGAIGKITPTGRITEFPLRADRHPGEIIAGPDGNVWFIENGGHGDHPGIGRMTPTGHVTEFADGPNGTSSQDPYSITRGPDGDLWFTEDSNPQSVRRITLTGRVTRFTKGPRREYESGITDLAGGAGGCVWFIGRGSAIGRITTG